MDANLENKEIDLKFFPPSLTSLQIRQWPGYRIGDLKVQGSFSRFPLLKELTLGLEIMDETNGLLSIFDELPSSLESLIGVWGNIGEFFTRNTDRFVNLETLKIKSDVSGLAGASIASMTMFPRHLRVLVLTVESNSSPITDTFIKSLPRTLQRLSLRKLRNAPWTSDSAACLAYLPKRLQKLTLKLDIDPKSPCNRDLDDGDKDLFSAKRPKLNESHALPNDLLYFLPLSIKLSTDDLVARRNFNAARKHWLLQKRKDYFSRWNLAWPYSVEDEAELDAYLPRVRRDADGQEFIEKDGEQSSDDEW